MTKYLLDNRLAPLTFSWGFVEQPLDAVTEFVRGWKERNFRHVPIEPVIAALDVALHKLEPLVEPRAELLLSTKSGWTAYFGNGRPGGTSAFWVSYVCKEMRCRGIAVSCIPNTMVNEGKDATGVHGEVKFLLIAAEQREFLNFERGILVAHDAGAWAFDSTGAPLPFEQLSRYSAARVVDRFTPEMLEEYCATFGIQLFDPAFYGPSGSLIKILDRRPNVRPQSLEEIQRKIRCSPS